MDTATSGKFRRIDSSARCCNALTAPGVLPSTFAVSSIERSETTRSKSTSRWSDCERIQDRGHPVGTQLRHGIRFDVTANQPFRRRAQRLGADAPLLSPPVVNETTPRDREHPGPKCRLVTLKAVELGQRPHQYFVRHGVSVAGPPRTDIPEQGRRDEMKQMLIAPSFATPRRNQRRREIRRTAPTSHVQRLRRFDPAAEIRLALPKSLAKAMLLPPPGDYA